MQKILLIGATSAIARQCARRWAMRGDRIFLVARDNDRLQDMMADLRVRGADAVLGACLDLCDVAAHSQLIDTAWDGLGGIDLALLAHGTLSDQARCQDSVAETLAQIQTNALSHISLMTLLANRLQQQGGGCLAVISSVAGDRGRQSNYVYGSAKAMVSSFASGLRQRLSPAGVAVLTIKPGFVDTPMTRDFAKGPLWASADQVAGHIVAACDARRDVVYSPWFWRWIMLIIRLIPESLFKRIRL